MNNALWLLTKLRFHAAWRKLYRSAKTWQGALFILFVLGFLGSSLVAGLANANGNSRFSTTLVNDYGPLLLAAYMLSTLLTSVGEKAIYFTPHEIDMLFPAPFTRKQLLAYKISNNLISTAFLAVLLSVTNRMQYRLWIAGLVGAFLTLGFLQLSATFISLVGETISAQAYTRGRRVLAGVLLAGLAFASSHALTQWDGAHASELPAILQQSAVGRVVLSPFQVFCKAITAEQLYPDFARWGGIGLSINVLLLILIFRLDANFNDAAVRVSQKTYERMQRFRSGGVASRKPNRRSTRVPMPPTWSGIGPISWRQLVRAFRVSRGMLIIVLIMACAFSIPLFIVATKNAKASETLPWMILGAMAYGTLLLTNLVPVGFRADIDRIEVFKSLPIRPWAVCFGQIFGATCLVSLMHWTVLAVVTIILPHAIGIWLLAAVAFPLYNLLLLSIANSLFLLFPVRVTPGASADIQTAAKAMLTFFLQMFVFALAVGIVAGPAAAVFMLTKNWLVTGVVATGLLIATNTAAVMAVWFAYTRFDVSKHLPD